MRRWRRNGFRTVTDIGCSGAATKHLAANGSRVLAAGVVICNNDPVGLLSGDLAHHRTFAGIAIATGTEHHMQQTACVRANRRQRSLQRVGVWA